MKLNFLLTALVAFLIGYTVGHFRGITHTVTASATNGRFLSSPKTEWLEAGRDMSLTEDFVYIDPNEVAWLAPKGSIVNGASIPRPLWSVIGGPFEGKYRNASIVHDVACEKKNRPHNEVHRMFFHACVAGGVPESEAKRLYWAVATYGPQWREVYEQKTLLQSTGEGESHPVTVTVSKTVPVEPPELTAADLAWANEYFSKYDPSLDEIDILSQPEQTVPAPPVDSIIP